MGAAAAEADRTLFVGNLETKVTEELLFELFHQAGPVIKVKIPKDKDGKPKQFAFVNFKHEVSVPYAMNLLNGIKLYGRPIKIQFRSVVMPRKMSVCHIPSIMLEIQALPPHLLAAGTKGLWIT
ncbi:RBM7 isoform 6 [Pongo abelii]|uniref:RNA-binding protein 7 n=1 Tax=Pongo abelii TaxID=9601 RepID=A0A2J8X1I8_PONAB|nr:RBM7 isoform 6 [Pongo abelii]